MNKKVKFLNFLDKQPIPLLDKSEVVRLENRFGRSSKDFNLCEMFMNCNTPRRSKTCLSYVLLCVENLQ